MLYPRFDPLSIAADKSELLLVMKPDNVLKTSTSFSPKSHRYQSKSLEI